MRPSSPPTLYDVAREAGVSLATASRVVNGSERRVAEAYRIRVLEAAERTGYSANLSAQATARGTSRIAALLVSDISDPFFSALASGVARAAEREGLLVTMAITDRNPARELDLVRELRGLRPRLVVLAGSRTVDEAGFDELVRELNGVRSGGGRVVLIGHHELPFASVQVDNAAGSAALADALVASGRRRFAILAGPAALITARDRAEGFAIGLARSGAHEARVVHGEFTRDAGYAGIAELLAGPERPDAIFAVNDMMAIGALTALRDAGVDVPDQIAVAGFDDIAPARDASPALSTVRIDLEGLGEAAVDVALGDDPDRILVLPTEIVLRASTGA